MFLKHWKLREQPFGVTPDPKYLYFSPGHREALASVFCGIEMGQGFLSLVARPGMGKTTLIFQLLKRWKGFVQSAFLFQTQCSSRELIRYLLDDLGLNSNGDDIVRMHAELNEFLIREAKAGKRVVVFIDEAQNLPDEVLETVRLLSNFEAADRKLLQIVLSGQPELSQRLSRPSLAQLKQRIAVNARLDPLPPAEVVQYVKHRLRVAGGENPELFTPGALGLVAEASQGIPRIINALCFNALSLGVAMKCNQVTAEMVREAAKDSGLDAPLPRVKPPAPPVPRLTVAELAPNPSTSFWHSIRMRIRDTVRRRLVQVSGVCLLLGALAFFFTLDKPGKVSARSMQGKNPANPIITSTAVSAARSPVAADPAVPVPQQNDLLSLSPESFGYVIQPHDTLRSLCMSAFKRYDGEIVLEIRRLNPQLKDINHLEVGQEIHLPLTLSEKHSNPEP